MSISCVDAEMELNNGLQSINIPTTLKYPCRYTVEGRYLFSSSRTHLQISDIFHSKTRLFDYQFLSPSLVNGHVAAFMSKPSVFNFYPLNLDSVILRYSAYDKYHSSLYLGVGRIEYKNSAVIIEQSTYYNSHLFEDSWVPLSFPPDLRNGILCRGLLRDPCRYGYILLRTDEHGSLRLNSDMEIPEDMEAFAVTNEFVYGLEDRTTADRQLIGIDLVTVNLSTGGKLIQQPTSYWEELKAIDCENLRMWNIGALVGKLVFKYLHSKSDNKSFLVSLDTESLEWNKMVTLNGHIDQLISDRTRTLIARVQTNHSEDPSVVQYYRFVMDGPEKLSMLAWLQLNKMFNVNPSLYKFVLSKLPETFNLKNTLL
ncbi:hypothetical protein M3Y96_00477200 [Aphelenchoides besseyi]|nr:hypothetical protein M3Y96_00477200 [Aphelenchoides besseyi]